MTEDTNIEFNCEYERSQDVYDVNAKLFISKGTVSWQFFLRIDDLKFGWTFVSTRFQFYNDYVCIHTLTGSPLMGRILGLTKTRLNRNQLLGVVNGGKKIELVAKGLLRSI